MDADRACADQKIAAVICSTSCISHLWYATERDRVHKNRYEASGIDTLSNSGARGWTSFKRNILYAIRSLKINGVEINRSVCIHAQTARRCRTRRVHSSIHTATPTRRVPFASTENTSRCGLSVPDEPDAVDAVCTRQPDAHRSRTVRASGKLTSVNTALHIVLLQYINHLILQVSCSFLTSPDNSDHLPHSSFIFPELN